MVLQVAKYFAHLSRSVILQQVVKGHKDGGM